MNRIVSEGFDSPNDSQSRRFDQSLIGRGQSLAKCGEDVIDLLVTIAREVSAAVCSCIDSCSLNICLEEVEVVE